MTIDNSVCPPDSLTYNKKLVELGKRGHYSSATIDLTSRCNASCEYCFIKNNSAVDMSFEQIIQILDKLANENIMGLTFTGGEIFLREDILDIFQYAIDKGFWKIAILSNAIVITNKHIDFIISNSKYIASIQISIFSNNPEIHDKYIGIPGALKKSLAVAKKFKHSDVFISFAYNILEINYNFYESDVEKLTDYCNKVDVSVMKLANNCNTNCNQLIPDFDFISRFFSNAPHLLKSEKARMQTAVKLGDNSNGILCKGIYTTFHIDSIGNLSPCISFRNIKEGTIFDKDSLYEIFQKHTIYNKIKTMRRSELIECNNCKYNNYCSICIALSHTETDSFEHISSQYCNYATAIEKCQ